jgi:hypothetical protein
MKNFEFGRIMLRACIAASLLAGCGGSQPPIGALGTMPQTSANATHADRGTSWMLPEAKSEDLLYISDYYGVHAYSFPKGRYVGNIDAFGYGLCTDKKGDVFVTDEEASRVYEYPHGGTQLLNTFSDNSVDFGPVDCSVDPTTGNLAVTSADSKFVVVFPNAEHEPKVYYEDMRYVDLAWCAYDNKGDLFVDQIFSRNRRHNFIGELPKGATQFTKYLLDQRINDPGGIQFDGKHVAIEAQRTKIVYRLRFSGSQAVVLGSTRLQGTAFVQQYWIQGTTLIGPDNNSAVYFWKYPGGGSPVSSIQGFTLNYGSTVSVSS